MLTQHCRIPAFVFLLLLTLASPVVGDTVPCSTLRDRIIVPLRLNHLGPYYFVLDAGIDTPVLNAMFVDSLSFATKTEGNLRYMEGPHFLAHDTLHFEFNHLGVLDLSRLDATLGQQIAGLFPLYQPGYEVTVDVASQQIHWVPLGKDTLQPDSPGVVPIRVDKNKTATVDVVLTTDLTRPCILDLHLSESASLYQATLLKLNLAKSPNSTQLPNGDTIKTIAVPELKIDSMVLAPAWCRIVPDTAKERLGMAFLKRCAFTLNYEAGLARFAPLAGHAEVGAAPAAHGIALSTYTRPYWSLALLQESPAAKAGVLPGDQLMEVQGMSMSGASYKQVAYALQQPYTDALQLQLRRDGETLGIQIPPG